VNKNFHRLGCLAGWALAVTGVSAQAPGAGGGPGGLRPIEGQYIVVFNPTVANPQALAAQLAQQQGAEVLQSYRHAIKGFAARMPSQAVEALRRNPNVAFVEQDARVTLDAARIEPPASQFGVTWGLDRIDQTTRALDSVYRYRYTGSGVYAFVIDTGIRPDHVEFTGRLLTGVTAVADGNGTVDCNGHGTHVAGTVGGSTWGVAKGVTLVPVRVLDCAGSGSYSGIIAGVDWIAGQTALRPAVANMSLGGGKSLAVNSSVAGAVAQGVTMVVAAGNSNADACNYSPASEATALTVGATTSADARATYSNYGPCLDLFAPGSSITSAWFSASTATNTISGTSMAAPHVAGAAALVLAAEPSATPARVASVITSTAIGGVVSSAGSRSPNRMLYTMSEPVVPQTVAVAALTGSATALRSGWSARVTVKVGQAVDLSTGVAGVAVSGRFGSGSVVTCVTGASGSCDLSSGTYKNTVGSVVFTVTGASGTAVTYNAAANAVSQVAVYRP
jgi:subtilisin family serine protease